MSADMNGNTLKWISQEYYDLNGTHYETLQDIPSSLEFSQLVRISRPALIRGCPVPVAQAKWTDKYLVKCLGDRLISVAVTPNGRADAITRGPDNTLYFVEPHTQQMTMSDFLSHFTSEGSHEDQKEVYYLQSQDGNLYGSELRPESEFESLRPDVPSELPWCSEALGTPPDAVNLWIGDHRSVTSIHSDPYENIYCVIRGSKTFTLLPPTDGLYMKERTYLHAKYERSPETSELFVVPSDSASPVRWSSVIDPNQPRALSSEAHPIHITVRAGESLYLPAGWWHYVSQSEVTIAINYWYDMESRGMAWVWLNFLRGCGEPASGNSIECEEQF